MRRRILRRCIWDLRRRRIGLGLLGAGLLIAGTLMTLRLTPEITELALATATDDITLAVNGVVAELTDQGELEYGSLVTLERDGTGAVTALIANSAKINALQAKVTSSIVRRFADEDMTRVSIPIGNLLGGTLLSGRGPRLRLDVLSVTNVVTSFRNDFTSAGINQTRHRIIMDVEVTLEVMLGRERGTDTVNTEVNVAETVIVGAVPNMYASLG